MAGGYDARRCGVVAGVGVAHLGVVHAVVAGVGVADRLADGQRVVDGTVDVDYHLGEGLYGERLGEVPEAIEYGYEAVGLVGQSSLGVVVVVGGLCIVGCGEADA